MAKQKLVAGTFRWVALVAAVLGAILLGSAASAQGESTSIAGTTVTAAGEPVAELAIDLFDQTPSGERGQWLGDLRSGDDGSYTFSVEAGCYVVTFIAPAGETFVGGGVWSNRAVCVEAGEAVSGVDAVVVGDGAGLTTFTGSVLDDGSATAGVVVDLFTTAADGSRGLWLSDTVSDETGRFSFVQASGCYTFTFIAPGDRVFTNGSRWHQPSACGDANSTVDGIDAVLEPATPTPPPTTPPTPPTTPPTPPTPPSSDPGPTVATHHETIPNPVYNSTQRVADSCKVSGSICEWNAPGTWSTGAVPDADTLVIVDGNVQISDETAAARSVGIYPGGHLRFNPGADTLLRSADVVVFSAGHLEVGSAGSPIGDAVTAQIVLRDLPFADDPEQHLRGIVVVDGRMTVHGRTVTEAYLRLSTEARGNSRDIELTSSASAAGWRVGDEVVLPKSSQCPIATNQGSCPFETEAMTIESISADGLTVTLSEPLQYEHPGARSDAGEIDFLPHLLNKSRNVIVRSENPNGVRGHVLLHGRAEVDLRYARLQELGRTDLGDLGSGNQKGRYPLHAHHLIGPIQTPSNGYQFTMLGNVIDFGADNKSQGRKWGLTLHASHYGLVEQNIVDHASGAGLVTEDGSETGNRIARNFVVRVVGGNNARTDDRDPGDNTKLGRAGVAYWFNGGGGNEIVENVAAAVAECTYCYGFKFDNVRNGEVMIPSTQGADPHADGGNGRMVDSYTIGLTAFADNEVYAAPNGLTIWWVCTEFETPREGCSSTVKDFSAWHVHRWGYLAYETNAMTLDGYTQRGDASLLVNRYESVAGLFLVDYFQRNTVIRGADIQGVATAIEAPVHRDVRGSSGADVGVTRIESSLLIAGTGILVTAPSTTNGSDDLAPQTTIIEDVQFGFPATRQESHISITPDGAGGATSRNVDLRNDVRIINYNRQGGDDLYVVPTYHDASRCDPAIGNCNVDRGGQYPFIDGGRVYDLSR